MKILTMARIGALLLLGGILHADEAPSLSASLDRYKTAVDSAIDQLPDNSDPRVLAYLRQCLEAAVRLTGYDITTPGVAAVMRDVADLHNAARKALDTTLTSLPPVRAEYNAYRDHLQPLIADDYLAWVALQNELLERKYFKTQTSKTANFLEGYVNGHLKLTKADPDRLRDPNPPRPLGVSPWEAIFRFEPTLVMRGDPKAAIMGSAGLTRTIFPRITQDSPPKLEETPASKYLRKAGGRLGVGATRLDDHTRLLLGAGVQLNAVGLWILYEPHEGKWFAGFSAADLSKLQKALGWFN